MLAQVGVGAPFTVPEGVMTSLVGGVRWGLDRMVAVGYGILYDYIFERFVPYQELRTELVALAESIVPEGTSRRDLRVLDVACGPGNMTVVLAEAGFSAVGVDPYGALVDVAREKRRAEHLAHLAFRQGDLAAGGVFASGSFDLIVNVHSLYVHPRPDRLLGEAFRVLKPGGHAVFVNRMRPVSDLGTVRSLREREGVRAALSSLLWIAPNSVFEAARQQHGGPHYWDEPAFGEVIRRAGFTVLMTRRTFLEGSSVLAFARKDAAP